MILIHDDPATDTIAGRVFYVTVMDAGRTGFLLGPYNAHSQAKANVNRAKDLACKADPWSHFYSFGTASYAADQPLKTVFGV